MAKQFLCVAVLIAAAQGCAPADNQPVPVSGVVTLNGSPIANVGVCFLPTDGDKDAPGSSGFTDEHGRYELSMNKTKKRGALVGRHRVVMMRGTPQTMHDASDEGALQDLPERYGTKSHLEFDVPTSGTTAANFDLKVP